MLGDETSGEIAKINAAPNGSHTCLEMLTPCIWNSRYVAVRRSAESEHAFGCAGSYSFARRLPSSSAANIACRSASDFGAAARAACATFPDATNLRSAALNSRAAS